MSRRPEDFADFDINKEGFRTFVVESRDFPAFQIFRGQQIDRLGFVVWDGKLKRPYEVLREERYGNHPNPAT